MPDPNSPATVALADERRPHGIEDESLVDHAEQHETTTWHGTDDEGEWGAWVCITCGAAGADLGSHSDAIVAASQHRQDAS